MSEKTGKLQALELDTVYDRFYSGKAHLPFCFGKWKNGKSISGECHSDSFNLLYTFHKIQVCSSYLR